MSFSLLLLEISTWALMVAEMKSIMFAECKVLVAKGQSNPITSSACLQFPFQKEIVKES